MKRCSNKEILFIVMAAYLFALVVGFVTGTVSHASRAGFSGADEPSHFLNGVFVGTYLKQHVLSNPLAYAVDYYIHYPKISIGHWPPAYYGFLGLLFLVVPPTAGHAFLINLVVSALPVMAVAAALARISGRRAALAGVVLYVQTPLVVEGFNFFMLDQILAALAVAATAAWLGYVERQTWGRAGAFAALFTSAVLVKGNGWLLMFVPACYLLLTRAWEVMKAPALYVALLMTAGIVVPWYWLTSGIAADGFNYHAGPAYAALALRVNLATVNSNLTWLAMLLAAIATLAWYRRRQEQAMQWRIVCACLSLMLATLTLQSLVPVDIVDRYMAPLLPALIVLAVAGLAEVHHWVVGYQRQRGWGVLVMTFGTAILFMPGMLHLYGRQQKVDFRLAAIVPVLSHSATGEIYLIDGTAGAEGAFIAEMAVRDPHLMNYVVRASKLFAESDFMGTRYRLKLSTPQQVLDRLHGLGIENIVVVRDKGGKVFPHSVQLAMALALPSSPYHRIRLLPHGGQEGTTEVYQATGVLHPNIAAARALGTPPKANGITNPIN